MDGVDNRDFLPASTSSKPAKAANGEITPHEEQDKKDEPLPIRRKSLVHVPDMSLDDLELDDEDNGQDPDRGPQRSSKESPLRKGPQDSIPTLNNANVAEESNEPDSCRICSFPAEPGMPLYHPCKCSGTIRHVHQECLRSWLNTSRRTRCDLCHHLYAFKKVYSAEMPSTLPARTLVKPMLKHIAKWARIALRVLFVGTIWLAALPALTYWCWKVGFWLSDYVSLRISGRLYYLELYGAQFNNATNVDPPFVMPSTSFSSSLSESILQAPTTSSTALPSATSFQGPLISAFESLQSVLQQQPTGTELPTPHPSSSVIAAAFSQLASVLESGNYRSRRSPRFFKPGRPPPDGEPNTTVLDVAKKAVFWMTGKPLFKQGSSFWLDILRFLYYTFARIGDSTIFITQFLYNNTIGALRSYLNADNSTLSNMEQFIEDITIPIVTGQIIAVIIVITFVALFFLREWVLANADGMFGDEMRLAGDQRNGPEVQDQNGDAVAPEDEAQNDVPGAFPERRMQEPDIDMRLADPRPPSPNVISLEEQEVLMREVMARRKIRETELNKSGAVVEQWRWGKREKILEKWRERKIQELQLRGRVETPKPEVRDDLRLDQGGLLGGDDIDTEGEVHWDRFGYGLVDAPTNMDIAVEHIEHSPRQIAKVNNTPPEGPESVSEEHSLSKSVPSEALPLISSVTSLYPTEPVISTPSERSTAVAALPTDSSASAMDSTSFIPDPDKQSSPKLATAPPSALAVTTLVPLPLAESETSLSPFFSLSNVTNSTTPTSDRERGDPHSTEQYQNWSSELILMRDDDQAKEVGTPEERSHSLLPHEDALSASSTNVPATIKKTPPSVFATLVPPTPPSMRHTELPFSIRGHKAGSSRFWSNQRTASPAATTSSEPASKTNIGTSYPWASKIATEGASSASGSDRETPASDGDYALRSRQPFTTLTVPRPKPYGKWPSPKQRRRYSPNKPPESKAIVSPVPRRLILTEEMLEELPKGSQWKGRLNNPQTSLAKPAHRAPFITHHSLHRESIPLTATASVPKSAGSNPDDLVFRQYHSASGPRSSLPFDSNIGPFQSGPISAPVTPGSATESSRYPNFTYIPGSGMHSRYTEGQMATAPFFPFTFVSGNAAPQGHHSTSVHAVHGPPVYQIPVLNPASLPLPPPNTTAAMNLSRGHPMSMGMASGLGHSTKSESGVNTQSRARAFTTGEDGEYPQGRTGFKGTPQAQSHQRSSSLSSRTTTSKHFKPEENSSLRYAPTQPTSVPWYGFPYPHPDVERERQKLEEWEEHEKRRIYVPKSLKRAEKSVALDVEQARKQLKPLVSQPSEITTAIQDIYSTVTESNDSMERVRNNHASCVNANNSIDSGHSADSANPESAILTSSSIDRPLCDEDHPLKALSHASQCCETRIDQDQMTVGEVQSSPISFPPEVSEAGIVQTSQGLEYLDDDRPLESSNDDDSGGQALSARAVKAINLDRITDFSTPSTSKARAPAPGSIILPGRPTSFEDTSKALKRPGLPLATSPISVDDRSPATMALYQAPEEVRDQIQGERVNVLEGAATWGPEALDQAALPIANELLNAPELEAVPDHAALNDDLDPPQENDDAPGVGDAAAVADEIWEDDWTHMLEVVGAVGPWHHIVQNAALVIVIFNVTLILGVFFPYMVGKISSLMLVDPLPIMQRLSQSNEQPSFFGMQFPPLWTPDHSVSIIGKGFTFIFGDLLTSLRCTVDAASAPIRSTWNLITNTSNAPPAAHPRNLDVIYRIWSTIRPTTLVSRLFNGCLRTIRWYQQWSTCSTGSSASFSLRNVVASIDYAICSFYPDVLKVSPQFRSLSKLWLVPTLQAIATERISAILFGYVVTLSGLALRNIFGTHHGPYMALTLLKVGSFLVLEALGRPLVFGVVIDLFTLPLFPNASIQSRISFLSMAPYSSLLRHWLVGNVVIVQFVHLLDHLQKVFRMGALRHVTRFLDPSPPSIRYLVSKPISWHVMRFLTTLFFGLSLLWLSLGLVIDVNNLLSSNFAPLRWNLRRPFSDVPVDLILLNIFIPATFRFLKLKKHAFNSTKDFFIEWCRYLNLQNVFFEEMVIQLPDDTSDGTFWRIPVTPGAIRLAGKPNAIETDANGNGITEEGRDLIDLQALACEKAMRNPMSDYRVVYYPNHFYLRLGIFFMVGWLALFGAVWSTFTLPISMGRLAFKHLANITDVHDGYTWIAGLYIFWLVNVGRYITAREVRRWAKYLAEPDHRFTLSLFLTHTMTMLGRLMFAVVLLILVLPLLIGLLFEVYFVLPLSYHVYPGFTPTLRIFDAWAAGLTICALTLRAARLGRGVQGLAFFERIRREGWFKVKARALASQLILICATLVALIFSPFILEFVLPVHISKDVGPGHAVLKVFVPMLSALFLSSLMATSVHSILVLWVETIRDEKYLKREVIENLENLVE